MTSSDEYDEAAESRMLRRKYTMHANVPRLQLFLETVAQSQYEGFVERVTPNKDETVYYVVLQAAYATHQSLIAAGFREWSSLVAVRP